VADDGRSAVGKLERHIGEGFGLPRDYQRPNGGSAAAKESKLVVFWDAMKERSSWKKVYGEGLY